MRVDRCGGAGFGRAECRFASTGGFSAMLADAIYQAIERALDAAEQTLRDGLDHENPMTRLKAAAYFLRLSADGRQRGWGRRAASRDKPVEPQTVTLKWIDPD
jgi:hypothetical protein